MRFLSLFENKPHQFDRLQPPPVGDPGMHAWLEEIFGNEENYGGAEGDGNYASTLGGGGDWAICTSWANMVRDALPGRTQRFGFWVENNPSAKKIAEICGGHDFTVVDGRYIVDGWAKNVEQLSKRSVFDMKSPADRDFILNVYGDPKTWEKY